MYQDPEIATLIRKLETKRNDAVRGKVVWERGREEVGGIKLCISHRWSCVWHVPGPGDSYIGLETKRNYAVRGKLVWERGREGIGVLNYLSATDDLVFDMYQDPEIATLIRKLETKRNDAVRGKDVLRKVSQGLKCTQLIMKFLILHTFTVDIIHSG